MTRKGKFVLAGVAAATVGLAAAGAVAQRGHWDGHHKGPRHFQGMGLMGLGFGGPPGRVCRGDTAEFADIMLVRLEHRVKPTADQKAAFDEFKTATRSAAEKLREGCPPRPEATGGERPKRTPIERLAMTQTSLEASLDALKVYRPAAEKFYNQLNDEQKAKLAERGGKHGKRDRGPHHERGEKGPPSPDNAPATPDNKG